MAAWRIELLGGFRLLTGHGREIEIKSRKARAVLALLALNRGQATRREELATNLWPESTREKALSSLRQALRELSATGDLVRAERDVCALSGDWECDALDAGGSTQTLLPEMPEVCFEGYRAEMRTTSGTDEWTAAAGAAVDLLEWVSKVEPGRTLDLLYVLRELIPHIDHGIAHSSLEVGLQDAEGHPHWFWGQVQLGQVLMWQGRIVEGLAVSKHALKASPGADPTAWTAAVFSTITFLLFKGAFDKALAMADSAMAFTANSRWSESRDRLAHARAHIFAYRGDPAEGYRQLAVLRDDGITPAMRVLRNSHRAVYAALAEMIEPSEACLAKAHAELAEHLDVRTSSQIRLAEMCVAVVRGSISEALAVARTLAELARDSGLALVEIHGCETCACLSPKEAEVEEYAQRARALRVEERLPILPLDELRIALFTRIAHNSR